MRVSLSPGPGLPELDLELAAGVTLDSLRPLLADVSGCPAARTAPLAVGGLVLDGTHRTGTFPLVAGARLRVGHTEMSDDGDLAAVRARWHVAVVVGPDAGRLWPVAGRIGVGRAAKDTSLQLTDPCVSQSHLQVRCTGRRVRVRDVGSANGARRTRAWARHRLGGVVPRWWTRWRAGDRVSLGGSVLELRASAAARVSTRRPRARLGRRALLAGTAVLPALGSLALVAGTGNPALLALGLAGPALAGILSTLRPSDPASNAPASSGPASSGTSEQVGAAETGAAVDACELAATAARAVLVGEPPEPGPQLSALAPAGVLAVCGAGARDVAATLILASQPAGVEVIGAGGPRWAWSRWLDSGRIAAGDETGPRVVVVDGAEPLPEWGGPGRVVVLVDPERVPSWCTARLDAATGTWDGPDGVRVQAVRPGSLAWAQNQARRLAGVRSVRALGSGGLPDAVTLGGLGLPMGAPGILGAWASADSGLRALVGAGPEGRDAEVDLAREGPHVLVAGTTGSGKSELLRAIVTSLALRYPPTALAFALVDFKGGAGFGALAGLPHVVGTVTDLDAHEAARALGGLAAELRRRKALLAREGVADLREWPAGSPVPHPGRLVVVIDEFRALAESLPDLMGALERIATQGRSLGVHLVLATQRPSGVVSAELRANVALRFALRVTDTGDSSDVIEVPDAAHIPPSLPGRALLRRGPGPIEELQVAQVGLGDPPVRLAPSSHATAPTPPAEIGSSVLTALPIEDPSQGADFDTQLVAAVHEAAAGWRRGAQRPGAPWLPALPTELTLGELSHWTAPEQPDADTLPFGLADVPEQQRREVAAWDPGAGHLLAVGGPASGRSTLLVTLGTVALSRGWAVHAVGLPADVWPGDHALLHGLGTVCGPEDPRRLALLVTLLREAPPRTLLLVDDAAEAWRALEHVARGGGAERFAELL
ncbi:MAG: FHA domain-containing protein, partial [Actinomycetales bacterium]|nr:FHA domain-containing protein [Actinomycetales bacterium]